MSSAASGLGSPLHLWIPTVAPWGLSAALCLLFIAGLQCLSRSLVQASDSYILRVCYTSTTWMLLSSSAAGLRCSLFPTTTTLCLPLSTCVAEHGPGEPSPALYSSAFGSDCLRAYDRWGLALRSLFLLP